jgi:hypothetical protein
MPIVIPPKPATTAVTAQSTPKPATVVVPKPTTTVAPAQSTPKPVAVVLPKPTTPTGAAPTVTTTVLPAKPTGKKCAWSNKSYTEGSVVLTVLLGGIREFPMRCYNGVWHPSHEGQFANPLYCIIGWANVDSRLRYKEGTTNTAIIASSGFDYIAPVGKHFVCRSGYWMVETKPTALREESASTESRVLGASTDISEYTLERMLQILEKLEALLTK